MQPIEVKRIYDAPEPSDGLRILVDRIWPRGVSKEKAQLTVWMKEIAPSTELRTWFHQPPDMPERFVTFKERYLNELSEAAVQPYVEQLRAWAQKDRVTLLYAAKDTQVNHAMVLKEYLEQQ